jgi:hypothetical protein
MSAFHDNALMGASGSQGYTISRSVRLRSSASAYFNRTLTTPTNNKIWTWSAWVKKGTLTSDMYLVGANGTSAFEFIKLSNSSADNFEYAYWNGSAYAYQIRSTLVLRDPSAWYHIVMQVDTTQATAANRVRMYVNNVEITSFSISSYPSQNTNTQINSAIATRIGAGFSGAYFDGYLTEVNFIDGQALTPSSFGETDAVTGVWKPKKYAGTYGTNGFYLNFSDNSSNTATTIGKDYSGNGNNWTPNNISVTSGVTYDSMLDTPTPYADGGNGRGNYAVLNPLDRNGTYGSVSDGNLTQAVSTTNHAVVFSSMAIPTGKTYLEVTSGTTTSSTPLLIAFGLATQSAARTGYGNTNTWSIKCIDVKTLWNGGSSSSNFGGAFTSGTTMRLAYDSATGYLWIGDGSNWYNSTGGTTGDPAAGTNPSFTISTTEALFYFIDNYAGSGTVTSYTNFGQRPFSYTPPTGFKALNTFNLPEPTIKAGNKHMDVVLRTGTGTADGQSQVISSLAFTPDLVWNKARSNAFNHNLVDSVRGNDALLLSNSTNAETSVGTTGTQLQITANGFTAIQRVSYNATNQNGVTYAAWNWKAGGTSSSNTNGSITSTVSVNATAGFSIVSFASGTSADRTAGHGLGVAPSFIVMKSRDSGSYNWSIYHASVCTTVKKYLTFTTAALSDNGSNIWGSAFPTSTVFGFTSGNGVVASTNCIAYCFAEVAGYSKFGSYTGNGSSDGPFIFCNFRPAFIMIKRTDTTGNWTIHDNKRLGYNGSSASKELYPNLSNAEGSDSMDQLSNGFKLRDTYSDVNASGGTYVYAAFSESPFKLSLAR